MQDDRIHWNGAADRRRARRDAGAGRSRQVADPRRPTRPSRRSPGSTQAKAQRHASTACSWASRCTTRVGDAEAALAAAPVKVDATYRTPRHNHNAIELHAVTVAWEGDTLRVHDASQLVVAYRLVARADVRPRRGAGACHLAVRRRRLRRQDACGSTRCSPRRRRSWPGGRCGSCCRARASTASSAAARRPSSASRSAPAATARFDALIHTGVDADDPRTTRCPSRSSCRRAAPMPPRAFKLDVADGRARHARPTPSCARPGESVGTFALESAIDELADDARASIRSSCASATSPRRTRPRACPSRRATSSRPSAPAPSGSAGAGATRRPAPRREGEWLVGMGCATATYPYYRMPGGAARITLTARRPRDGRHRRARDGHGHRDRADAGRRRAARAAARAGDLQLWRLHAARRRAGRRLAADRVDRRVGDRRAPRAGDGAAEARRQRFAARRTRRPTRSAAATAACASSTSPSGTRATPRSSAAPQRDDGQRSRQPRRRRWRRMHWSMHSHGAMFCEVRVNAVTGETACQPLPRLVRLRPHPQSQDGGQPVPRRHHHGARASR